MDLQTLFLVNVTIWCVATFLLLLQIAGMWAVFRKAEQPGWSAIVPGYNAYVLVLGVARLEIIWFILLFVPIVGIFAYGVVCGEVARRFRKGVGFGVGLAVFPFLYWPWVGFSEDHYVRKFKPAPTAKRPNPMDEDEDEEDDD